MGVLIRRSALPRNSGMLERRAVADRAMGGVFRLADAWKYCALAIYACWLLVIGAHHEPWFDEAQAWLLARDNGFFDLMVHRVRYEGSPGLWHALLWLVMRAGLPYSGFYLVSAAFAIAGAVVVLWRAPFPPIVRLLVLGSYFFSFQYGVVARSYALDLLFIPLLAACFERRIERPIRYAVLIGILANCNTHSFLLAVLIGIEFAVALTRARFWTDRPATIALLLAAGLGLIALATAWQPADNAYITPDPTPVLARALNFLRDGFIDSGHPFSSAVITPNDRAVGAVVSVAVILLTATLLSASSALMIFATTIVVLVGFSAFLYGSSWHSGILLLTWLFAFWVEWPKLATRNGRSRDAAVLMTAVLGVQAIQGVLTGLWDYRHDFTAAPRVADTIARWRAGHPGGRIVAVGYKPFEAQPYFSSNLFANYHDGRPKPAYAQWDRHEAYRYTYGRQIQSFDSALRAHGDLLLTQLDGMTPAILVECLDHARQSGYRPVRFYPAYRVWRSHREGSESILMFERSR
jgi:hypothetical protein